MTEQELKECIAEVKHSDMPKESKKKIMNVLYEKLHKNGWILCEDRLPEWGTTSYLVCLESGGIFMALFLIGGKFTEISSMGTRDFCENNPVIAWQPLPEPYKETAEKNLIYPECDCQLRFCPEPKHGN